MDGSNDVRPETRRHAPDPSIDEMLRRARDAQLGGHRATNSWWSSGLALLLVGIVLGVLGTVALSSIGIASTTSRLTTMSAPTALPTIAPAPTAVSTPSITEIASQVQVYYDNAPAFASSYDLIGITGIAVERQDATQLTVCVAYVVVTTTSPATLAGGNTRLFTLALGSDGSWQVVQMGAPGSCSLSS